MSSTEEEIAYHEFMAKMAAGEDTASVALLNKEFSEDAVYSGTNLFVYLADNYDPVIVFFQAIHYGCRETFDKLQQALLEKAAEDGCNPSVFAEAFYFVELDDYSSLGDQALAERIASGVVPDLWPVPDVPGCFGIPSRSLVTELEFDPSIIDFDEARNGTRLAGNTLEMVLPIAALTHGREDLNRESERLTPEEFGDRSRDCHSLTAVCSVATS